MQEFSEKVLVLRVGRFREADAWVRFLSPTRGVLTAFAFGGCKSRRRFCGCLDPCNEVLFKVKSNRTGTYLNLEEGVLTHSPSRLRSDGSRLGLAVNCIKFAEAAADRTESGAAAYSLLRETLLVLDGECEPSPMVPVLFRARLAFEQGLWPQLEACVDCGRPLCGDSDATCGEGGVPRYGARFLVEQGHALCPACNARERGLHLPVCNQALETLARVRDTSPENWQNLNLPPAVRRECATLVDHFVRYHLGLAWEKGGFRKT